MINKIIYFIFLNCIFSSEPIINQDNSATRNDFLEDRAKGYLLKGKAKTAVTNYGNFLTWDYHPAGLWGDYTYLPNVSFITGIPGHEYSSKWSWNEEEYLVGVVDINLWSSADAYSAWVDGIVDPENEAGNFSTIVYNTIDDRGDIAMERNSIDNIVPDGDPQWVLDNALGNLYLYLGNMDSLDPNLSSSRIGLAFPWAIRPSFLERTDEFDNYDYGEDLEEWTEDDNYVYYGANTAESWFVRDGSGPQVNTDWQATTNARYNTHALVVTSGEIFGETSFTDPADPDMLLAHSGYPSTWPTKYSFDTGSDIPFWPGWWADEYYGDSPDMWGEMGIIDCNGTSNDDDCWKPVVGNHISDMDVYMEFDDRWAQRGNHIVDEEYETTGYPMGLKVMTTGHSYGVSSAEDIMFFTVKIRNESGDYCAFETNQNGQQENVTDDDGNVICGEGMIMPDGTKLNRGLGFDYKKVSVGFYMDADVLSADASGNDNVHTNTDDFMRYIDCLISQDVFPDGCPEIDGDSLRISMAVIGDWDGNSHSAHGYSMETDQNVGSDFGVVAVQLLDTPYATDEVDLNGDGYPDIFPGEKLKMTDLHWFDWFSRPGVVSTESNTNCSAGEPGCPVALNKEEIQYKVMAGDTTNLTDAEKTRYFHTANPQTDLDSELNPHFDSIEGLEETSYFQNNEDGLDCVLEITTGPFDLEVGEQISLSFTILYGQDMSDLKNNAELAQITYNNHYQIFSDNVVGSGDLNGDNNLDILDVVILVDVIMASNGEEYIAAGDINGDGYLNIMDVVQLVNLVLEF